MGESHFPPNPEKILNNSIATHVAVLLIAGKTKTAVCEQLGLTPSRLRTIMKSDECIRAMRDITNHEKDYAKARAAQKSAELIDECFRVLKHQLKNNNLQAVQLTLKASGVFDEFDKQMSNDAKLVVVMPGATPPEQPAIDITPKEEG